MARSVTYNGITKFKPGGITKINTDDIKQTSALANSVVALVGEAEGGKPSHLYRLASPSDALTIFKEGPLVDAIRNVFQPSNDPLVPGGASEVLVWKTNQGTQSSASLPSDGVLPALSSSVTSGTGTTLVDSSLAGDYEDDRFVGTILVLRPWTATAEVASVTAYNGTTGAFTTAGFSSAPSASDDYILYPGNRIPLLSATSAAGTTTTLPLVADVEDEELDGLWVKIYSSTSDYSLRQITATVGSTDTITVFPALPSVPVAGTVVQVLAPSVELTSLDYGIHTNQLSVSVVSGTNYGRVVIVSDGVQRIQSPDLGGRPVATLLYRGAAASVSDSVAAGSTASVIQLTTGGLGINSQVNKQVLINGVYTRVAANTASSLTVYPPLPSAPSSGSVEIMPLTSAAISVSTSSGVATNLSVTLTGVVGDDISVVITPTMTLRQLAAAVNANPNYLMTVAAGVNQDTILASTLDRTLAAQALYSASISTSGVTRDIMAIVEYINSTSQLVSASRSTSLLTSGAAVPMYYDFSLSGGSRGVSANSNFQEGLDQFLEVRANQVCPLIDEDLANEGYGSTATWASVAAQLASHVGIARGTAQHPAGERSGYIGYKGSLTNLVAAANSLNDEDIHIIPTYPTLLNASGTLVSFGPRMGAVLAAGMRAGVAEVGEPLTHKYIRALSITQDPSWSPTNLTDATALIRAGVLFAEPVPGKGIRWVRDLTTHVSTDNLCFVEGSVRDAIRYVAYDLRTRLVERFTGRKAAPATIASIKSYAAVLLDEYKAASIIVDSTDPMTGATVNAWYNLRVTSNGDTALLEVGFFPVPGINFILQSLHLQIATQSA